MFRIRRIYDTNTPINKKAMTQVQTILNEQFKTIRTIEIERLPDLLKNPLKYGFRSILFVADNLTGEVKGFALLFHAPDLNFCYLDYISTAKNYSGKGVGGALYERTREESLLLGAKGLFFECKPDDSGLCKNPDLLRQNRNRLKFYEKYGARPLINTKYETPVKDGTGDPPYLVVDILDRKKEFSKDEMKEIVKAILERKYPDLCEKAYVKMVVNSIQDDPVKLRPYKHIKNRRVVPVNRFIPDDKMIDLVYNDKHSIHHVKERGYVESPVRIKTVLASITRTGIFRTIPLEHFSDKRITAVHDRGFYNYLKKVCQTIPEKESVYPYVFPLRNSSRPPKKLPMRAGYYCIDTFTPLNKNAFLAARQAVDCALTAAKSILNGSRLSYALARPPGHHAEKKVFGGFCYMNSTAVAADYLSAHGEVAVLDIDYHHGNGQQSIFYDRRDVLTISIHVNPRNDYPFFSGFLDEVGEGEGTGFNVNYTLPEHISTIRYFNALRKAISRIKVFDPKFLVVALGADTARGDPTGTWSLDADDFESAGNMIGLMSYPTLFVQEGGYETKTIGRNLSRFFKGVWEGSFDSGKKTGRKRI
ncbi:acetylpolyamine amidohydrolase [candidate division WOR-3 bacterium]|nr:acetylpolyamine amidohydrolase [candidate division WOR-3 bacterium]